MLKKILYASFYFLLILVVMTVVSGVAAESINNIYSPDNSSTENTTANKSRGFNSFISDDPNWDTFISDDPNWDTFISDDPDWDKFIAGDPDWDKFISNDPDWDKFIAGDPDWDKFISYDPDWDKFIAGNPDWDKFISYDPNWDKFIAGDPDWDKFISYDPNWDKYIFYNPESGKLVIYDSDLITSIPSQNGCLTKISSLRGSFTVDSQDNLLLADYANGSVIIITPYQESIYVSGIDRPRSPVYYEYNGYLYVGSFDGSIQKISPENKTIQIIASGIWSPQAMGMDYEGTLYVAGGYDGKIYKISQSGTITQIDSGFGYPKHMVVTPNGIIFVTEDKGQIIQQITTDSSMQAGVNYKNVADVGEPIMGMAMEGDYIYISYGDTIARINRYDFKNEPIISGLNSPSSLAIKNGQLYVTLLDGTYRIDKSCMNPSKDDSESEMQWTLDSSELVMTSSIQDQLPGTFDGYYTYEGEITTYPFKVSLKSDGENLTGTATENRTTFGPDVPSISSTILGTIKDDSVEFIKTYDFEGGQSVSYSGSYDQNSNSIYGTWVIEDISGDFVIYLN